MLGQEEAVDRHITGELRWAQLGRHINALRVERGRKVLLKVTEKGERHGLHTLSGNCSQGRPVAEKVTE